jgi:head-tail adaptor
MTLNPGKMRDRIRLQKRGDPDPFHGTDGISDLATVWAQYRPASGREFREGSVAIGEERAVFTVAYRENLHQVDRFVHLGRGGNRIWNISSVVPVGFKSAIDIHATTADITPEA